MTQGRIASLIVISLCICILSSKSNAQRWKGTVINDPSLSSRCQALIEKRDMKLKHKQKIWVLIIRNKNLNRTVPKNKITLKKRLLRNLSSLQHEYVYIVNSVQNMTEDIILKGCPGMVL